MQVLILNSGRGTRMGDITKDIPKCLVEISKEETILSRQLKLLKTKDVSNIIITTGAFHELQKKYVEELNLPFEVKTIKNNLYSTTNYIYSMFLTKEEINEDILLLHGDLVFEEKVLDLIIEKRETSVIVSSTITLPEKDFKAKIVRNKIDSIGIELMENSLASQPMYYLSFRDWKEWIKRVEIYCNDNRRDCYAENALNEILKEERIKMKPIDVRNLLCKEIDSKKDLDEIRGIINEKNGIFKHR